MSDAQNLKNVPLHDHHLNLGARMVPFAGFSMPVKYTKIKEEHQAVRNSAGLFDVSHMGRVYVTGSGAIEAVDRLVTNDVSRLSDGRALYTVMCNEEGGIIDDLVVYRLEEERLLLCINAGNRERDLEQIGDIVGPQADIDDRSGDTIQLAVQGPKAQKILGQICNADLEQIKFFRCRQVEVAGVESLVARTGYTGEDGFELYLPAGGGEQVFEALMESTDQGLTVCGLGCRDTLRLEAGLLLHGQDIDETTNPLEANLSWLVKFESKGDFVGREALEAVRDHGAARRLRGFVLDGRGVLRAGYSVEVDGQVVGELTSGSYAPTLEESIGLGYIDKDYGDAQRAVVDIRGRSVEVKIVDPPFYERSK